MKYAPVTLAVAFVAMSRVAAATGVDCSGLRPIPPQNVSRDIAGKLDAAVDGWFAKIAKVGGAVDGTYKEVADNVLPQFPHADQLYIWERVLYLKCQIVAGSSDLSTQDKLHAFDSLIQASQSSPPPTAPSEAITNSGNDVVIVHGNGNSVNSR